VVVETAQIAGARLLTALAPDLAAACHRFLDDPASDKSCRATTALTEALNQLDHDNEDLFLRGIRHVQMEMFWGAPEPEDMAAHLRGNCAFGLMRIGHKDRLNLVADLLADRWKAARYSAVQALGVSGLVAAIPLLRFKARIGDREPDVTAECLT